MSSKSRERAHTGGNCESSKKVSLSARLPLQLGHGVERNHRLLAGCQMAALLFSVGPHPLGTAGSANCQPHCESGCRARGRMMRTYDNAHPDAQEGPS